MSHPIRDHICEKVAITIYYRPQRSWAKVIFSQACVKNSVHRGGGCLPQCMLGYTPPSRPPKDQTPQRRHPPEQTPQGRHTPGTRHPPSGADTTPPGTRPPGADTHTPGTRHPPPPGPDTQTPPRPDPPPPRDQTLDCSIRSTSGTHPTGMHSWFTCVTSSMTMGM